jgi:hypothetical protein
MAPPGNRRRWDEQTQRRAEQATSINQERKEQDMKLQTMVLALTCAIAASASAAAAQHVSNPTAPDIRQTDPRAHGPSVSSDVVSLGYPTEAVTKPASVRADDRAGFRGIDAQPAWQDVLDALKRSSPTQIAGLASQNPRDAGQIAAPATPPRPDDRAGVRGPGPTVVTLRGKMAFDWADWGIGAGSGIGLTLVALAGISIVVRRRTHAAPAANAVS